MNSCCETIHNSAVATDADIQKQLLQFMHYFLFVLPYFCDAGQPVSTPQDETKSAVCLQSSMKSRVHDNVVVLRTAQRGASV